MRIGLHAGVNLTNDTLWIDDKGIAGSHHTVPGERTVFGDDLLIGVGQQLEGQALLGAELLMRIGGVGADAQDGGLFGLILSQVALEIVGFDGAALSHVLRVEIQDHPLTFEILQVDGFAFLRHQLEFRRFAAFGGQFGGGQGDGGHGQREGCKSGNISSFHMS